LSSKKLTNAHLACETPQPPRMASQPQKSNTPLSSSLLLRILAHPATKVVTAILALAGLACFVVGTCGLAGAITLPASGILVGVGAATTLVSSFGFFKSMRTPRQPEPRCEQTPLPA
jgi:uncharacterized RDD family membrane protein YckC